MGDTQSKVTLGMGVDQEANVLSPTMNTKVTNFNIPILVWTAS